MGIYDYDVIDVRKRRFDLKQLKGKVVVIVNVASLCGFTVQYKDLEYLYERYKDQGLEIIAFPCNQFGVQEPFDSEKILYLCKNKFGVTFPIMDKIEVNGELEHPLYTHLKRERKTDLGFKGIRWNFEKFVINREGQVVARFELAFPPLSLEPLILRLLNT